MSLESLLARLGGREFVPSVPSPKKERVQLEPTAGAVVPSVPSVPPEKIKTKVDSEESAELWVICRTETGKPFRVRAHNPEHAESLQRAGLTVEALGVSAEVLRRWDCQRGCWATD